MGAHLLPALQARWGVLQHTWHADFSDPSLAGREDPTRPAHSSTSQGAPAFWLADGGLVPELWGGGAGQPAPPRAPPATTTTSR